MFKRLVCLNIAILLVMSLFPLSAFSAEHVHTFDEWTTDKSVWLHVAECTSCSENVGFPIGKNEISFGTCTNSILWTLTKDGTLSLYGGGAIPNYDLLNGVYAPWHDVDLITSVIVGEGITEIGDYAFTNERRLVSVNLPSTLKRIGEYSFSASGLRDVTIPDNVTEIDNGAFSFCPMKSVILSRNLESIGEKAFFSSGISDVFVPASVKAIGSGAFNNAYNLKDVNVSADNNYFCSLDGVLFSKNMNELLCYPASHGAVYTIPDEVQHIGNAFGDESLKFTASGASLEMLVVPLNVTNIESDAFISFDNLKMYGDANSAASNYAAANNIAFSTMQEHACVYDWTADYSIQVENGTCVICGGITKRDITIIAEGNTYLGFAWSLDSAGQLQVVGNGKVYGTMWSAPWKEHASDIKSIIFGEGITEIKGDAFSSLHNLKTITLPDSLECIDGYVFAQSPIEEINVGAGNAAYASVDGVLFSKDKTTLVRIPYGLEPNTYTVPSGVKSIGDYAFYGHSVLEKVEFPATLVNIGTNAFAGCSRLENVSLPRCLETIGREAFRDCEFMSNVVIPSGVTTIGYGAFAGCDTLADVTLPNTLTSIEENAFCGCAALKEIAIPEGVTEISAGMLAECDSMTSVSLPDSLESIEYSAFSRCSELDEIVIHQNVIEISENAFGECEKLTIYGDFDSCAEIYAQENGIPFEQYVQHVHNVENWIAQKPAGVGTVGSKVGLCVDCGENVVADIPQIGDENGNGVLDVVDVLMVLNAVINNCDSTADMNGDGQITLIDIIKLIKMIP